MATKIYVVGQLNIDYIVCVEDLVKQQAINNSRQLIGGTAFNAAKALKDKNFEPVIVGKIGKDPEGQFIKQAIKTAQIDSIIGEDESKPTGCCRIVFSDNNSSCQYFKSVAGDANQFDLDFLKCAIEELEKDDLVFLAGHFLTHTNVKECKEFIDLISRKGARIILDVVPHAIYQKLSLDQFNEILRDRPRVIIAEFATLMRLINPSFSPRDPVEDDWEVLFAYYATEVLVVRYGPANIAKQQIRKRQQDGEPIVLEPEKDTGLAKLTQAERRGFGDVLSANFISTFLDVIVE